MLNIDDDMDNLFKKAAENYSIKSDNPNWDKVSNRLQASERGDLKATGSKKKYKRLLWLFLLLPFAFICNEYNNKTASQNDMASSDKVSLARDHQLKESAGKQTGTLRANTKEVDSSHEEPNLVDLADSKNKKKSSAYTSPVSYSSGPSHVKVNKLKEKALATASKGVSAPGSSVFTSPQNSYIPEDIKGSVAADTKPDATALTPGTIIKENNFQPVDSLITNPHSDAGENSANVKTDKHEKTNKKERSLYAGIITGPDVSSVKFQKVKDIGWSLGILAGYQLNRKLSFEAGVALDKKFYYSEGEYFDTRGTVLSAWKIDDISGKCKMITATLNARYNFINSSASSWFFALGSSSYFMKNEDYTYSYKYNGMERIRQMSYKNSSNDIFSTANVSFGYIHKIRPTLNFRIEPYLRIPVRGVGTGDLRIMSTGLHVGITKKIL